MKMVPHEISLLQRPGENTCATGSTWEHPHDDPGAGASVRFTFLGWVYLGLKMLMCMCVNACVCRYACVCTCMCVCVCRCMCACMHAYVCTDVFVHEWVRACVCVHVCVQAWVWVWKSEDSFLRWLSSYTVGSRDQSCLHDRGLSAEPSCQP